MRMIGNGVVLLLLASYVHCIEDSWLDNLKKTLTDFTENGLFVSKFQEHLNKKGIFGEVPFDGKLIADTMAQSMSAKLTKRSGLVEKVRKIIVDDYDNYLSTTPSKECCGVDLEETSFDLMFRAPIYAKDFCIIKSQFSNDADLKHVDSAVVEQWKLNLKDTPEAKWQFYGSVDGLSYLYPGVPIGDCDNLDPRIRPWFAAAALAFKKVVVIILDVSTNMAMCKLNGIDCLSIAKEIITVLFNTLSSSDYIGLVTFDEEFYTPEKLNNDLCIMTDLAEATKSNRDAFLDYLNNIRIKKGVNSYYSAGFSGAATYLKDKTTQNAHTTVVFLTATFNSENTLTTTGAVATAVRDLDAVLVNYFLGTPDSVQTADLNAMIETVGRGTIIEINRKEDIMRKLGQYYKAVVKKDGDPKPVLSQPYYDEFGLGAVTTVCQAVFSKGEFVGVIAVDIPISDLFSEAIEFQRSRGYAFLINVHGNTLSHPLLPKPSSEIGAKFVDPKIELVEADDELARNVFQPMMAGEDGDVILLTPRIHARGFKREGIHVADRNISYSFRKVQGTMFSLCVVSEVDDAITNFDITEKPATVAFTYHDVALQNSEAQFCGWFSLKASDAASAIKFAPMAFTHPFNYLDEEETSEDVAAMKKALEEEADADDVFSPGVVSIVQLTSMLAGLWESTRNVTYPTWRYIGTERGVYRMHPGTKLAKTYDPTERAWYQRALNMPDKLTISAPYLDTLGTGHIVTIAHVVTEGTLVKPFGVMGMDIPVHYFYMKMLEYAAGCDGDYICFLMDSAGFIIVHPDWFGDTWNGEPPYESSHISQMEWDIAAHMIKREYMKKKICVDLYNTDEQHFYEITKDKVDHTKSIPAYEFEVVPGTNLYLVRKHRSQAVTTQQQSVCKCEMGGNGQGECTTKKERECECPCLAMLDISVCKGTMNREDYYSCFPQETAALNPEAKEENIKDLKPCFDRECSATTESGCLALASCGWCRFNAAGKPLGTPYCAYTHKCFFGKVGHGNPYFAGQESRGAQIYCPSSMAVMLAVLVALFTHRL